MSLPHILETARKLGIPVIITNDRGESPQVVMPFEDFASMVGVTTSAMKRPRMSSKDEEEDDEIAQALADLAKEEMERGAREAAIPGDEPPIEKDDRFIEENFYFEPLEDEAK
jgi:hypothetical protein